MEEGSNESHHISVKMVIDDSIKLSIAITITVHDEICLATPNMNIRSACNCVPLYTDLSQLSTARSKQHQSTLN